MTAGKSKRLNKRIVNCYQKDITKNMSLTLSVRRNKILLRAELVVEEVPLTSDLAKMHAKGHYCFYFRHDCLRRKCASFCCILIVFSVIFSDVKAEKLPHTKTWSVRKVLM